MKTASVWTCRALPWGGKVHLFGVLFLNGGTERELKEATRRQFGERCTIDQIRAWPDGTDLQEAIDTFQQEVTRNG